ncbi:putative membrane protein [Pontibacter mucosus]|uniref:Putative membrane protein n=1 Tax=Pontibacter mucosus TaxID=1649266 RepID=A0A2T5YSG1_9BACT|nr:DUF4142 domain-containing protein [Pontibacter mucosus]PTX22257.1 putative membrane protein [Pontibacter mucosus]
MKKIISTGFIAGAFLFAVASCGQQNDSVEQAQEVNEQQVEDTPMEDQVDDVSEFATEAASSGMLEVEAGNMAQKMAQNQQVKDFAKMMVADHTKANEELRQLAQKKNMMLPDSMSNEHRNKLDGLRDKKGADFDRNYMDLMVSSHEDAVEDFEEASRDLQDAEVQKFAADKLPKLREHLESARKLRDTVKK